VVLDYCNALQNCGPALYIPRNPNDDGDNCKLKSYYSKTPPATAVYWLVCTAAQNSQPLILL